MPRGAGSRTVADTAPAQNATTGAPSAAPDSADLLALARQGEEALKRKDPDAFLRNAPIGYLYVTPSVIYRPSREDWVKAAADCETRNYPIDSAQLIRLGQAGALLAYHVRLYKTCRGRKTPTTEYFMEAFARRDGRWEGPAFVEMPMTGWQDQAPEAAAAPSIANRIKGLSSLAGERNRNRTGDRICGSPAVSELTVLIAPPTRK